MRCALSLDGQQHGISPIPRQFLTAPRHLHFSLSRPTPTHFFQSGADVSDLGELLYTFLLRYGEEFDYQRDAVSVVSGGIVPKRSIKFTGDGIMPRDPQRLAVECPLSGGREALIRV